MGNQEENVPRISSQREKSPYRQVVALNQRSQTYLLEPILKYTWRKSQLKGYRWHQSGGQIAYR